MSDLADLAHFWGGDLTLGPTQNLAPVFRSDRTLQRILRRLLTNPGDYIWQPDYGAGLPAKIGTNISVGEVTAIVTGQIALEPSVARNPAPQVTVMQISGGFSISAVIYDNAGNGTPLAFSLTG
ncbi:MAG TPA: phage tail protein [Aliidongia sp.]|nr:phage tail protein [Aliidongia sp.]